MAGVRHRGRYSTETDRFWPETNVIIDMGFPKCDAIAKWIILVIWSRFSGDMTNETLSGWRIAIARVFPEPVPDIIVGSKPASSARAACTSSWSLLGTVVFEWTQTIISKTTKNFLPFWLFRLPTSSQVCRFSQISRLWSHMGTATWSMTYK